ncbi:Domain of Uncharacterized protein function 724 6, putative isoform 1 [Theobroma cacao]|uniref:Domain of Uncharacterized protein function 724 6, putative isoform 1 n=1 Tax=Theobroma cacao TaxID=3641 RepID=A0A061DTD0_THECC|nr:Domain of Uncharacterized protein function 724 6, putative isoform 1 [Theobroma cacao]
MVNPPPDTDALQQQPFGKATPVEVSSDEEGFRGAWYLATILEFPPKSTSKKRKKALVQYKTLLAEDGSSPLTEHVDPAFVRPLPPQEKEEDGQVFEVNDVVDARYRDGWWTGVVRRVLEKSKYRVYFDNPPDVIEFESKDLRVHWDWIDGKWVRPEKQQSTGSIFSSGTAVEVSIDKESIRDVWFPALVIKELGENSFLVKYQSSRNDDESGTVKVVVDSLHIRPTPPRYADRNYELLERVDTTYNFGWRSGVITKVLTGRRYNVFFKHGNEDKELTHTDIRPNVEWINGKWVSKSKEVLIASEEQEQIGNAHCGTQNPVVAGEHGSLFATKDSTEDKTPLTSISKNFMEQPTPADENNALLSSKKKIKLETPNGNTLRSRPSKKSTEGNTVETRSLVSGDQLKDMLNETSCKEGTPKTGGTGTRLTKKTVIVDQPCAKSESPLTGSTTQTASNDCLFCQHHRSNWKTKRQKVGSVDSKISNLVKRNVRARKSPSEGPQVSTAGKEGITGTAEEINEGEVKTKEVEMPIILGLTAKSTKTSQAENSFQIPNDESLKLKGDPRNSVNDSVGNENMEIKEQKVGVSNQKRKRGRPRKSVVTSPKAFDAGKEQNRTGGLADEKALKDCTSNETELSKHKGVDLSDAFKGRTTDISAYKTKEVHLAIADISNMADEDQPLRTWIGGMHSSVDEESRLSSGRLVNGWNEEREGLVDVPVESLAIDARGRSPFDDDRSLPFVKKSPVWRTIESMDVFQIVPQKPHFQPLVGNKEEFIEGSAIGIMVTFAGLFEKISMLHFDDPRNTFDSILESLNDLEKHGFDVTLLQHRLNELLSIKEGQGQHLGERENAGREIIENTKETTKFEDEMEEIEKKITELQERHTAIKSEKETKDLKIASLRLQVDVLNDVIQTASQDFKKVATAPWKLP